MPLCFGAVGSVRASSAPHWENCAAVVQIFCPVIRQPPSTRVALVLRPARSDPAPGSENSWHQIISPRNVGGRKRCFCSSVPNATIDGMIQAAMPTCGRLTRPAGEFLGDDDLLDRAGGSAPRLRQMRQHPSALGERDGALLAVHLLERRDLGTDFAPELFGVGVQVDVDARASRWWWRCPPPSAGNPRRARSRRPGSARGGSTRLRRAPR